MAMKNAPDFLPDEPPREMIATQQEMMDAKVPLQYRDWCAHLYIPLKKCRIETRFMPWKCKHERHEWDECQVADYYRRIRDKHRLKLKADADAAAAAAAE